MASPLIVQPADKDTLLNLTLPTYNYGISSLLSLRDTNLNAQRTILEFDISGLPAGATLVSATLQIYYYGYDTGTGNIDPVGKTAWAYKQTRANWAEGTSTGAESGDGATWNTYDGTNNWTTAGGDFVTSNPAGGSTIFPASFGWMSWDVLAIVQDAYDGSIAAELLVKFPTENQASGARSRALFRSSEYVTDTSLRPKLTIEYTAAGWSNIAKVNGVASAGIAKVNGVAVANIAKINGVAI